MNCGQPAHRLPASTGTECGANGTGYFNNNVYTLFYMPMLLSHITRKDFLLHPWYRNAGQALTFTCPPESRNIGFGDNSEKYTTSTYQYAAFADFLARETEDGYAGWYARQAAKTFSPRQRHASLPYGKQYALPWNGTSGRLPETHLVQRCG